MARPAAQHGQQLRQSHWSGRPRREHTWLHAYLGHKPVAFIGLGCVGDELDVRTGSQLRSLVPPMRLVRRTADPTAHASGSVAYDMLPILFRRAAHLRPGDGSATSLWPMTSSLNKLRQCPSQSQQLLQASTCSRLSRG